MWKKRDKLNCQKSKLFFYRCSRKWFLTSELSSCKSMNHVFVLVLQRQRNIVKRVFTNAKLRIGFLSWWGSKIWRSGVFTRFLQAKANQLFPRFLQLDGNQISRAFCNRMLTNFSRAFCNWMVNKFPAPFAIGC